MFRNQYDSDVTVWSPQGRLHQVDYAVEAMKQGSATVGLKSATHAVVVALKRAQNELCSHQKKIFEIDTHAGVSIAGLLSDGRILARFCQTECADWKWDYKSSIPINKLADQIQLKLQSNTQHYGRRPFGVGLLIAGYDKDGTHIIQTEPSGEVAGMYAASIGARSQSARTYLERHMAEFNQAPLNDLVLHALTALRDTLPAEENLNSENVSIAYVGKDTPFTLLEKEGLTPHLSRLDAKPRTLGGQPIGGPQDGGAGGAGGAPQGGAPAPQGGQRPGAGAGPQDPQPMDH
ncbi:hypothetical protein WR25_22936 [Diploscapter pachys]|uniref:Proteasome subunit alpha type n=1 Tax=Diploscapter pachys TaxID=2018661 RepID=A0A2A2L656_9BILA|nr:hypothetical protein WR25_22936 [Diploscapter pachys]